jgi:hypothetical protein
MRAVESLTMNLERLGYADWAHLPLLIGNFSSWRGSATNSSFSLSPLQLYSTPLYYREAVLAAG